MTEATAVLEKVDYVEIEVDVADEVQVDLLVRPDAVVGARVPGDAGRGDEARVVGHVHHEDGADFLGDLGEALEVDAQAVGRRAGDDQLGFGLTRLGFHGLVVDGLVLIQTVADDVEPLA